MSTLKLNIISQTQTLPEIEINSLTADTSEGQVTILVDHLPLFVKLVPSELVYRTQGKEEIFAVSTGFLDVGPDNVIRVITDSLKSARELSLSQASQAVAAAQHELKQAQESQISAQEMIRVEASLRQALLEEKIARKTSKTSL